MQTYVALLRGINVGGNNKVSMSELRQLFIALGYDEVQTYINSGNVLFQAVNCDVKDIETAIKTHFGFTVPILVTPLSHLQKIVKKVPADWKNDTLQKVDVLFLWSPYNTKSVLRDMKLVEGVDETIFVDGAVVWRIDRSLYTKSYMQKGFIGSDVYKHMTARNINTVRKLVAVVGK